ncbi:uncharacterized protein LOC133729671 [Rosa rugosa]|uniref:uncharacterized protein LOC133729671 n=1 Tax=Rosa rugosa TaxID=74645 RepID=UPI002B40902A|nr:uncharacterized protein LOC133729671 [Rosa rugosa]XP_062013221.1 uncharacterized protein LOC133729671 [Rosa rugosa]
MDGRFEPTRNFDDQQSLGTSGNTLRQANRSLNPQSKFKSEKPSLSYADLHHEITKNVKDVSPMSDGNRQKQRINRKTTEVDELVKYMSKLPSYLERGKNLQEKALNVGVLDWGRLEKWQYSHKQMPYRSSRYSPSSSNTTSCFSTDESSTHSSRGHSCSPARLRMHRPSLQSHFVTSPLEGPSEVVNSFRESVGKFQDLKADQSNNLNGVIRPDKSFCNNHIDIKVAQCKRKDSDPKTEPEKGHLRNGLQYEMAATNLRVKKNTRDGEFPKKVDKQQPFSENFELDTPEGCSKVVLLLPGDLPERNHSGSGLSDISDSETLLGQRAAETTRRSLPERPKEACLAELNSGLPHSCRFPSEVDRKHFRVKQLGSTGAASGSFQCNTLGSASQLALSSSTRMSPSRDRIVEDKKTTGVSTSSTVNEPHRGSELKRGKVTAEKVRSSSPFRRLSIAVGKMSKTSGSKDSSDVQQPRSTTFQARPGSGNNVASAFLDTSDTDNSNATSRARSSPLRRLLDPLLKPKVANCHHSAEPLEKDSISTNKACKSSKGRVESLSEQPGKVKLGMTGCRETNVSEFSKDRKNRPSTVQALLRVAVKNGLPLFTFAVHNDIDILAATMKKLNTSGKGDCSCIYTFFSVREVKKKNGTWLNHGSKGKAHEYIRNVVAQMKVSDSQFPNLILDQFSVREFVLFSVNLRQADCQTSDFQPNDELAATVVKIPKKRSQTSSTDWRRRDIYSDLPAVGSVECLSKVRRHSYSVEDVQSKPFVGSQGLISTTVILPSGAHSLPSNGGPSSLIERWSTGGSCDCGGWDLGCKLRILDNQNQASENLTSQKVCSIPDRFELCHQGGLQENQPALSLAPFKDGIYSVEFNSSLSVLQAFSICIAVLDSRNLCEFSEFRETKATVQDDGISDLNQMEGEVPARYASYPPLSPAGRV